MSLLSSSYTLPCGLELPNRLAKAAMAECISSKNVPTDQLIRAYSEWADGGWGFIFTGNVQVSPTYLANANDVVVPTAATNTPALQETWRRWAAAIQKGGAPGIVQLNHPGRQSPPRAGKRSLFTKNVAPSAVRLNMGPGIVARAATHVLYGTPREMTSAEVHETIRQFVEGARQAYRAGFKGVQLHGAHGCLLTQFLSAKTNLRTDEFGGTPAKRAEIVLRIIKGAREATSATFCIGIKLNSVDVGGQEQQAGDGGIRAALEQIGLIVASGIDFVEISGGSYEDPSMYQVDPDAPAIGSSSVSSTSRQQRRPKASTVAREAFFLDFARTVRTHYPAVPLMVTGGFRSRAGMEAALQSGACDIIGIGRPAAVVPKLPKLLLLNNDVSDEEAQVHLKRVEMGWLMSKVPVKALGAGAEGSYYETQIQRMGKGMQPINTTV